MENHIFEKLFGKSEENYCRGLCRRNFPRMQDADFYEVYQEYLMSLTVSDVDLSGLETVGDSVDSRRRLNAILLNKCKDLIKTQKRKKRGSGKVINLDEKGSMADAGFRTLGGFRNIFDISRYEDLKEVLLEGVSRLPEEQAKVIRMYYFEGYDHRDIAKALSTTTHRIANLSMAARKELKYTLAEKLGKAA